MNGWTSVERAGAWIAERHPHQTPERYGCRSLWQVLQESQRFEIGYADATGRRTALYRARDPSRGKP